MERESSSISVARYFAILSPLFLCVSVCVCVPVFVTSYYNKLRRYYLIIFRKLDNLLVPKKQQEKAAAEERRATAKKKVTIAHQNQSFYFNYSIDSRWALFVFIYVRAVIWNDQS